MRSLLMLLLVPATLAAQTPDTHPVTYLLGLQQTDGGYRPDKKPAPSALRPTLTALRAARYLDEQSAKENAKEDAKAIKFVLSCYDANTGGFGEAPGKPADVTNTIIALTGLADVGQPIDRYADKAAAFIEERAKSYEEIRLAAALFETLKRHPGKRDEWLAMFAKDRDADAPAAVGSAAAAILRLGGEFPDRAAVVAKLKNGQRPDGAYSPKADGPGDLPTTYRVVRSLHMLQEQPADAAKLRAFIGKCRNADGGYGIAPGQPSSGAGCYYAGIITKWLGAR